MPPSPIRPLISYTPIRRPGGRAKGAWIIQADHGPLALAGRDEARDFLDILDLDRRTLPLGALCWAAAGKDPGFTPFALLEILRRRGKYHQEDFARLNLTAPVDLPTLKAHWLAALAEADAFVHGRPPSEAGCLYHSPSQARFVAAVDDMGDAVPHFGRPGGVLPRVIENPRT